MPLVGQVGRRFVLVRAHTGPCTLILDAVIQTSAVPRLFVDALYGVDCVVCIGFV